MVDGYLDCHKKKDKGSITFVLQLITNNYKQPVTHKEQLQDVFFVQGAWHSQFTRNLVLRTRFVSQSAAKLGELGEARSYFYI